jgi:hypothetical protein
LKDASFDFDWRRNRLRILVLSFIQKLIQNFFDLVIIFVVWVYSTNKILNVYHGNSNLVLELANDRVLRFDRRLGRAIDLEWAQISRARRELNEKVFHLPGAEKKNLLGMSYLSMPKYIPLSSINSSNELIRNYFVANSSVRTTIEPQFQILYIREAYLNLAKSIDFCNLTMNLEWDFNLTHQNSTFKLRPAHGDLNLGNAFINPTDGLLVLIDLDCLSFTGLREFDFIDFVISLSGGGGWIDELLRIVKQGDYQTLFLEKISKQESAKWIYFYTLNRIGQDYVKYRNQTYFRNPDKVILLVKSLLSLDT